MRLGAAVAVGAVALLAACSSTPGPTASTSPAGSSPAGTSTPGTSTVSPTSTAPATSTATPTPTPTQSCAQRIVAGMSATERAGQLLMVGLDANAARTSLDALVQARHLGGVILLGGWHSGSARVEATTRHLASLAGPSTANLGLLLAADQEGGAVQQLQGEGFSTIPSALDQTADGASALRSDAARWARQLAAAGINVNLAPVADTVPDSVGRDNKPIGFYGREYSNDPSTNSRMVTAFVKGMRAGDVAATVKHFPGLGRITGNTDVTATGITDRTTTTDDAYLEPFESGIRAGADLVMVGSAIYSRIDPGTNAVFSRPIVTDLLRGRLGYDGVVITDDVGKAKAVAAVPAGERATRFVAAGGDIVLTASPSTVGPMHRALKAAIAADPGFAAKVQAAATRVVDLKIRMGLARCS
ncbi:glycoside hydrolase family 3 N-terminal domain-containing protein [Intrasporangium flavum]|uniref:glycoside hydrolase family 3 N-terminal domain-containing protein n=1 Tax=Intrasporangium flavum TaxID=1428657 RepID=UPI001F61C9C1|nr:glycoside hydrolase family 3 N-terminal domain-containing protein [Intrasporangium flavum]